MSNQTSRQRSQLEEAYETKRAQERLNFNEERERLYSQIEKSQGKEYRKLKEIVRQEYEF